MQPANLGHRRIPIHGEPRQIRLRPVVAISSGGIVYSREIAATSSRTGCPTMSDSDKPNWLAENLRLTAFTPVEPAWEDLAGSWKALVGDEPETVQVRPKEHVVQEFGPFRESILTFGYSPLRIDWIVHAHPQPSDIASEPWGNVSRFPGDAPPFVELMTKWLATSPEIKRLAFGAVLISPVSSRDEGYARVSGYLPFDVNPEARNFIYQINRRRDSRLGVPGLEINRLLKWSCMERRTAQFTISDTGTTSNDSPSYFAARLEVDINTAPEYPKSLDPKLLADLLSEFIDLGAEVAEKGDIP